MYSGFEAKSKRMYQDLLILLIVSKKLGSQNVLVLTSLEEKHKSRHFTATHISISTTFDKRLILLNILHGNNCSCTNSTKT